MSGVCKPGRNCWRLAHADRVTFLIDAAAYFDALATAMERAQRSILMVGWDFHSQAVLRPGNGSRPALTLAGHLDALTSRRGALQVRLLGWDYAPILYSEREMLPLLQFRLRAGRRVRFRFAADHPLGGSHHQKIVVIDDRLAFLGGLDLTIARWDDRQHRPDDARRRLPDGEPYDPFHDVQIAVDGAAARGLGELIRERWRNATGAPLPPPSGDGDPWPPTLTPNLQDVAVALARTQPDAPPYAATREVERLYRDAIGAAKQTIYIENQYLTSTVIREALARRLAAPDGPAIVVVTPRQQSGRLEQATMGALRAKFVAELRQADQEKRLRVVCPTVGGAPVNVHAKVMVVDDVFVRIGSANLSTRSMRLDTECDAAIEVAADDAERARAIAAFRDSLVAEHLGADPASVTAAVAQNGLVRAIDRLRGGERTLEDLPVGEVGAHAIDLPDRLLDPSAALDEALVAEALPGDLTEARARRWPRVLAGAVALGLLAAWLWTPLSERVPIPQVATLAAPADGPALRAGLATMGFALGSMLWLPVTVLIVLAILWLGPWVGPAVAVAGSLLGAAAGYAVGRAAPRDLVRRMAGQRLNRVTRKLAERGLLAVVAVRVVPVAAFTVTNMVAGSSRIRFGDFMLGTLLGMAPGVVLFALAADRVVAAAREPGTLTIAVAVALVGGLAFAWRRLYRRLDRIGQRETT